MVGWHHQLNEHKFEQAPGVGGGQESLALFRPHDCSLPASSVHRISQTRILKWAAISFSNIIFYYVYNIL